LTSRADAVTGAIRIAICLLNCPCDPNFRPGSNLAHHENPVVGLQVHLQDFAWVCAIQNPEPLRMGSRFVSMKKPSPLEAG
jgi:hypothetical protein